MTESSTASAFRLAFAPTRDHYWAHYRVDTDDAAALVAAENVPDAVAEALVAEAARPRASTFPDGVLVILRGANLNAGADPHDLVAVRMWVTPSRLITATVRRVRSVTDVRERFGTEEQPRDPVDTMVAIAERIVERMGELVDDLSDRIDALQERLADPRDPGAEEHQPTLTALRLTASALRRHIRPQREAMLRLYREPARFFDEPSIARLRETADRMIRYAEDLDELRERASVLQDGIEHAAAAQMNRNMYVLSVIAAVFLPLGFITGLLGINVGGIPGADVRSGFWIVVAGLAVLVVFELWYLRRRKMW